MLSDIDMWEKGLWQHVAIQQTRLPSRCHYNCHDCHLFLSVFVQVSSVPLWMRKSVSCQIDIWEKGLLWQHAARPLPLNGIVGIVHLLRVMQEVCVAHTVLGVPSLCHMWPP